ncbi:spore coat protein YutH [Bacillus sp. JJ664]
MFIRNQNIIQDLFHHYQIQPAELLSVQSYYMFWQRNRVYFLVPIGNLKEDDLQEMKRLSDFMSTTGDQTVATFVQNVQGYYVSKIAGSNYSLFKSFRQSDRSTSTNFGEELAVFHLRGKKYSEDLKQLKRIGQWKSLWEKRLEQLERFWQNKVNSHPENYFEQTFIESFPYYLGMTENAIQYVVDTELDDTPQIVDSATICHQKMAERKMKEIHFAKIPTEWIYDHPSRDLAEWVRDEYLENSGGNYRKKILSFLYSYEKKSPLSTFSWRLLYARLLFPVHYFETIEGYYLSKTDADRKRHERKLVHYLETTSEFESFLGNFYEMIGLPIAKLGIREINWLK